MKNEQNKGENRSAFLSRRWGELHRALQDLADGKVIEGDHLETEDAIQSEIDEIEFEMGEGWMKKRRGELGDIAERN